MLIDVLRALSLVLVIEGVLLFAAPAGIREVWKRMIDTPERVLRTVGLGLMVTGLVALQSIAWTS